MPQSCLGEQNSLQTRAKWRSARVSGRARPPAPCARSLAATWAVPGQPRTFLAPLSPSRLNNLLFSVEATRKQVQAVKAGGSRGMLARPGGLCRREPRGFWQGLRGSSSRPAQNLAPGMRCAQASGALLLPDGGSQLECGEAPLAAVNLSVGAGGKTVSREDTLSPDLPSSLPSLRTVPPPEHFGLKRACEAGPVPGDGWLLNRNRPPAPAAGRDPAGVMNGTCSLPHSSPPAHPDTFR